MRFYMVGKGKSILIWDILPKTFCNSKFSTKGNYILFIGIKCISFPGTMNAYQLFSTFLFKVLSSERVELVMKPILQYQFPKLHFLEE